MSGGFISSLFKKKADEEEPSNLGLARVIKYEDLKKATNSFGIEIGNGGFGRVYLGMLRDGRKVAVKVLFDRNPKRLEQFYNEVTILSRIRHKNLVSLYGCTNPRGQELLLVYDYVPNGTVADHLHGQRSNLNLAVRVQIALETSEALAFLHALEPTIIHRDVKTSNILLDHDFHAEVADFGMCRLLPWDTTHVSTRPQGTMGYRDPEYDRYLRLSDKTDVYSFGVVLMELISGQEAVDVNRDLENIYLDSMARSKILNKKLNELVDPNLAYHSNGDIRRIIDSLAELASECLQPKGDTRPPMVQVVTILKGIQNEMQQIRQNEADVKSLGPQRYLGDGNLNNGQDQESRGSNASRGGHPQKLLPIDIPAIPLDELNRLTSNFSHTGLIGKGPCSLVFYATLSTGECAAIKKLDYNDTDFVVELSAISRLKHEHFVQLLGYCLESKNQILVYQFATHGSLHDILHGRKDVGGSGTKPVLSWNQRVMIAYGVARGLEYLNEKIQPRIVHQDVRSSNVLLFADYNPKITDIFSTHQSSYRTDLLLSGLDYDAPEYVMHGELTHKSNVYSFGIVLLERLTGRKPVDLTMPRGQQTLVVWAYPMLSEDKVKQCVDPKLNNEYPPKAVAKMAAIAALCIQYDADFRPNMSIVVKALHPLLNPKPKPKPKPKPEPESQA